MKLIKNKKSLIGLFCLASFVFLFATATIALAQDERGWADDIDANLPDTTFVDILQNVIDWGAGIVALVAVLVLIVAGLFWATAGGDEERTKSSRKWLTGGITGAIIALGSWAIVRVIIYVFFQG